MKLETKVRIDVGDLCHLKQLDDACELIGRHDLPEADQKLFGRIRGNDFTLDDAEAAVAIVHRRSAEMLKQAENITVFVDPKLQATWADGVRSSAHLAVREANQFMSDLREDLSSYI